MRMKRLVLIATFAVVAATIPISPSPDATIGIDLSAASCTTGTCGPPAKEDCICPDVQVFNHEHRCFE